MPMLRVLLFILCVLTALTVAGQNLVPNPDFETMSQCPGTYGELDKAIPWQKPNAGSTDYYHTCCTNGPVGVPVNFNGGYQPARSGSAYVGISTYKETYPDYREYLQAPLASPLKASACYYFEMWVNKKNSARYATDKIGVHFRQGPYMSLYSTNINVAPQIKSPPGMLLTDTLHWVPIQGYYSASGTEDHLIIGNFNTDVQSTRVVHVPGSLEDYAYYYVDDVSLTEIDQTVELGPDTMLCTGDSLLLDVRLAQASYEWSDGDTSGVKVVRSPGLYIVTVYTGTCQPVMDSIRVSFISAPSIDLGEDQSYCEGSRIILDAGVAYGTYLWQDGHQLPSYQVTQPGEYWVDVSNPCGFDQDTVNIDLIACQGLLFAPNAFTPDGDGINDYFEIKGAGLERFDLAIFDRWGKQVFTSMDPGKPWDGRISGQPAPAGVYHWVLHYTGGGITMLEKEGRRQGFVVVLR